MKALIWNEINSLAVKQTGKFAVYVSNGLAYDDPSDYKIFEFVREEIKAIYINDLDKYYAIMSALFHSGMFLFDTEEEQRRFYRIFEQPLTDSSAIYACTYDVDGVCQTENT